MLECMISVDNYLNETTRFAHVILPGPSPLETPHFDEVLVGLGRAQRRATGAIRSSRRQPTGPTRGASSPASDGCAPAGRTRTSTSTRSTTAGSPRCAARSGSTPPTSSRTTTVAAPERIIDLQVRTGPWGDRYGEVPDGLTLEQIKAQPHGIDRGPMVPRADEMVCTPDGLIDLAPEYIVGDLPRLARPHRPRPPTTASGS